MCVCLRNYSDRTLCFQIYVVSLFMYFLTFIEYLIDSKVDAWLFIFLCIFLFFSGEIHKVILGCNHIHKVIWYCHILFLLVCVFYRSKIVGVLFICSTHVFSTIYLLYVVNCFSFFEFLCDYPDFIIAIICG